MKEVIMTKKEHEDHVYHLTEALRPFYKNDTQDHFKFCVDMFRVGLMRTFIIEIVDENEQDSDRD